jgi:hypothetical protein
MEMNVQDMILLEIYFCSINVPNWFKNESSMGQLAPELYQLRDIIDCLHTTLKELTRQIE